MNKNNISKSHKVANKNINVEPEDPFRDLFIHVPYYNMATVAEGLKQSSVSEPNPTIITLIDQSYGIMLSIMWAPNLLESNPGWCQMNTLLICLYHNGEEIQHWTNRGDEYNPYALNYKQMQDFINNIVKEDIEEARNSGEDPDNDYMRLWLTGHMVQTAVVPVPNI